MREQLTQYVNLLFAGSLDAEDIRTEILQNTLDRYDDLISQGKTPEAAYRLSIAGIGDLEEILGNREAEDADWNYQSAANEPSTMEQLGLTLNRIMRAIAIGLFILSPIPVVALQASSLELLGVCLMLIIVAMGVVLLLIFRQKKSKPQPEPQPASAKAEPQGLRKIIENNMGALMVVLYFLVSFSTGAWHITWVIFLLIKPLKELAYALLDLLGV